MKNTFKRIAVIAMAVLMCVSAVVPAFAAGNACPGEGNKHTAYNCTYVEANKQEATCTEPGFVTGKCTKCQTVFSVSSTEELGHDWDATVAAVCGYTATKTCKRCEYEEKVGTTLEHLYTAWTLAEGTCVADARITKTCVFCDDVQYSTVDPDGHKFVLVSYVEPAKCLGKGVAKYECSVAGCDAVKEVEIAPTAETPDKHNYKPWSVTDADGKLVVNSEIKSFVEGKKEPTTASTCTKKGRVAYVCADCGNVVSVAVDEKPHDLKEVKEENNYKSVDDFTAEDLELNCSKGGNIAYWECRDCKALFNSDNQKTAKKYDSKDDVKVPALHDVLAKDADFITYEKLPTCTTNGLLTYSCPACDDKDFQKKDVELAKYAGHVYYNDVKTVAQMRDILTAFAVNDAVANEEDADAAAEDIAKKSDAQIEKMWADLGVVEIGGAGEGYVWEGYTPATCDKAATVTYKCLNCTYAYTGDNAGTYVFVKCNVATETTLAGEGFDKLGHAYADTYPLSYPTTYTFEGDTKTAVTLAGTAAYVWEVANGVEKKADCENSGRRVNYCVLAHQLPTGEYVKCDASETVSVAAYGHSFRVLEPNEFTKNVTGEGDNEVVTYSYNKNGVVIENAEFVTCMADGKAYSVCTREGCTEWDSENATSTGNEHDWKYFDVNGNDLEEGKTIEDMYTNCVDELKGYNRQCQTEKCKKAAGMEAVTVPARGHKYANTDDAKVLEALKAVNEKDATVTVDDVAIATLKSAGTCEDGAIYALNCLNDGCKITKAFEIKEGFGEGHVKTYIPNTAIAATCDDNGSSNKWYCANETCDYYGFVDVTDNKIKTIDDEGAKVEINLDNLKGDVEYGATHKLWDAKSETFKTVTYKNVPDANVSGCDSPADAKKVEAPVVDGKVVNYVAIEGTSLLWVYKYAPKDADHTVTTVAAGGFYCVECGAFDADVDFATTHEEEGFTASDVKDEDHPDGLSLKRSCESVGYTYSVCNGENCYFAKIEDFKKAEDHVFNFIAVDEDGKYVINAADWDEDYKEDGLNYVAPTCTAAGYAIDKCTTCEKVVTVAEKALGHKNNKGQALTTSCLNTAYPRKCDTCGVTVNKAHEFVNGICVECGDAQ